MATNKKVNLVLTKYDIAVYLYNDTLQRVVQDEIKIMFWGFKEAMAKPSTTAKTDALAKKKMFYKSLEDDTYLLEMTKKAMKQYEPKSKTTK